MILANNKKLLWSHLIVSAKANFEPLARGNLHHLMFITALFLVWTLRHMDPHLITDSVTKSAKLPREFKLVTYQFEYDA